MTRNPKIILAIACLVSMGLGCNVGIGGQAPNLILSDDFSAARWGTVTDENRSIEYVDNTLQMIVSKPDLFVWSTPNDRDYQNVHMEVLAVPQESASDTRFGLICRQQAAKDSFYYFAIRPDGGYAIVKAAEGQSDLVLTNNGEWAASALITPTSSAYHIGADCGTGTLTLYVDGQQIASAFDTSYISGGIALFAWSGAVEHSANVSFDDFLMTELPE